MDFTNIIKSSIKTDSDRLKNSDLFNTLDNIVSSIEKQNIEIAQAKDFNSETYDYKMKTYIFYEGVKLNSVQTEALHLYSKRKDELKRRPEMLTFREYSVMANEIKGINLDNLAVYSPLHIIDLNSSSNKTRSKIPPFYSKVNSGQIEMPRKYFSINDFQDDNKCPICGEECEKYTKVTVPIRNSDGTYDSVENGDWFGGKFGCTNSYCLLGSLRSSFYRTDYNLETYSYGTHKGTAYFSFMSLISKLVSAVFKEKDIPEYLIAQMSAPDFNKMESHFVSDRSRISAHRIKHCSEKRPIYSNVFENAVDRWNAHMYISREEVLEKLNMTSIHGARPLIDADYYRENSATKAEMTKRFEKTWGFTIQEVAAQNKRVHN